MKILVFSPIELPYTVGARYTGLERLAVQFAEEWSRLGHEVGIIAHKDTNTNVKLYPCEGYINGDRTTHAELKAFRKYESLIYKYDVIWDISHLHLIARYKVAPVVSVFSANPEYERRMGNEKAPYNLVSWSKWGVREIKKWYGRDSVYQETIMVDPNVFKPSGKRGDRWLTIGRMSPEKGNLNAVMFAKDLGLKLDVAGGRGSEVTPGTELTDYEKQIMRLCDENINFIGEVSDEEKLQLMQNCKALLYITNHVEITSHKIQEAMLCGAPVVIPNHGGFPEIVTQGKDGYLCSSPREYADAIRRIDELSMGTMGELVNKYSPQIVASNYVRLFDEVANGRRW